MGQDVDELILATHDNLPVIIFGHSMGSVVARTALQVSDQILHPLIKGLVLSGVPATPHWTEKYMLHGVASLIQTTGLGHALVQRVFTQLKFDYPVRRKFRAVELPENCWISSDLEECKIFNEDPYTNHLVAPEILLSIVNTLIDLEKATYFGPKSVDVMLITGRDDPVASFGDAARAAADRMSKAGHRVTEVYVGGARHEILRETASLRQEGVGQVIAWIRTKLGLKNGVI
jgi:alpha-beta hydrolase superfamily lysophospholipase